MHPPSNQTIGLIKIRYKIAQKLFIAQPIMSPIMFDPPVVSTVSTFKVLEKNDWILVAGSVFGKNHNIADNIAITIQPIINKGIIAIANIVNIFLK
ncbi:hypothetical protein GL982_10950 (plasmid) [Spiroplasma citri]|uniref:hypothetical protein n=1 Tax=Spiroplasma citri TaxID=2133 RepID=UPI0013A0A2BB|nr:hypothetical protein [Spiroplasma citri]QIA74061.1 hypothetical protein GL982_10950 [Spiroplasma citri]